LYRYAAFEAVERSSSGTYGGGDAAGELTIKAARGSREVTARYEIDDANLELSVRLPACYPLAAAELDCTRRVGISEARLRKWMLSVSAILVGLYKLNAVDPWLESAWIQPLCL
jgi:hypothetical protein